MARTVSAIKSEITTRFMAEKVVQEFYGFGDGATFEGEFSKVSLESVTFHVVAFAIWAVEVLFDIHKEEVEAIIEAQRPHRPKWYRDKALDFMKDMVLIPDTDRYDTSDMTDEQIAAARVVRYAVAVESEDASILTIKVAGEADGVRTRLDEATEGQLSAYLAEIKDAGVRFNLVNLDADTFNCELDIYYDAMLLPENVKAACLATIENYVENLPFNGEYTNMALVDALQGVEGVRIVEFRGASTSPAEDSITAEVDARCTPAAGYFTLGDVTLNMRVYGQV